MLTLSGSDRRNRVWQASAVPDATNAFAARVAGVSGFVIDASAAESYSGS